VVLRSGSLTAGDAVEIEENKKPAHEILMAGFFLLAQRNEY